MDINFINKLFIKYKTSHFLLTLFNKLYPHIRSNIHNNNSLFDDQKGKLIFDTKLASCRNKWIYHNEDWDHIKKRFENRLLLRKGKKLSTIDNFQNISDEIKYHDSGRIEFRGLTKTNDEWLYLYLDPRILSWKDFSWSMPICKKSQFKEFQFGFRYIDFYNRYRYRFQDDYIFFDIVINGRIYHNLNYTKFKIELGRIYELRIEAKKNRFNCFIDNKLMLKDIDILNLFNNGSIAIILWENNGINNLTADVGPIKVYSYDS